MNHSDFWKKSVLVGGGCGFIGSYLVPVLVREGAKVTVIDNFENSTPEALDSVSDQIAIIKGDLRDATTCDKSIRETDIFINLAAKAYGMEYSRKHNGEMLLYNLQCTLVPLDAARRNDVERCVVTSSSCVYPDDGPVPTPELDTFTKLPETVNEGYGWAKRIQELAGRYFANEYGMKITILRPFNLYGANYRWDSEERAHVIPALVKRVMDGEDPLVVWGSGQQRRNFLHASDAATLMKIVVERDASAVPVNIGYEQDTSVAELVGLICSLAGKQPRIIFDRTKPEGRFRKCADSTRLRALTNGYVPRVSLPDGIKEMIQWYAKTFRAGSSFSSD